MIARITWLTAAQGGRQIPFTGERYSTPARFPGATELSTKESWSLVVDRVALGDMPNEWIADVRFLAKEAPQDLLVEGVKFELCEGMMCTARGVILASAAGETGNLALNGQREKKRI